LGIVVLAHERETRRTAAFVLAAEHSPAQTRRNGMLGSIPSTTVLTNHVARHAVPRTGSMAQPDGPGGLGQTEEHP
jgi:hypothetical protein